MKRMERVLRMVIVVILVFGGSCSGGKQKEVEIPGVPPGYFEKWEYFPVDSEVVKEKAKEFFGGREYKAIWKWDTDGDGKIDYLLIEPHPKIVKGIKGGILIGEDGEVKLIIDRNKGIYTPEYVVEDFKREGIREGEVECIRFLFSKDDRYAFSHAIFTKNDKKKFNRIPVVFWVFAYQLIDRDLKLITSGSSREEETIIMEGVIYISKVYDPQKEKVVYEMGYASFESEENLYKQAMADISTYRLNKSKGIVFDPVNFDPENQKEVRRYRESVKKR
ncbi:MAG: hypothetical protein HPY78_10625 [Brevinematales bacterium]|nr:hypothetical protein [Brevinematales bacterium]